MSVFDDLAADATEIIQQQLDGDISEAEAAVLLSPIFEALSLNTGVLETVKRVVGRIGPEGVILQVGAPDNFVGEPGSIAIDFFNLTIYGPKDATTGWPAGQEINQGAQGIQGVQGPSGTITSVSSVTGAPGSSVSVALGGSPEARTMEFTIPRGDTGADTAVDLVTHLERAPAQAFDTPAKVAAFAGRGIELLFTSSFYRVGTDVESVLTSLAGFACTRSTVGYAKKLDGTYQAFAIDAPRITDAGITVEPAATNLFTRFAPNIAQFLSTANAASATAPAAPPIAGLSWVSLNNAAGFATAYIAATISGGTIYTISALIEAPDGVQPVMGASASTGDFLFRVGGAGAGSVVPTTANYQRLSGNVWRVSAQFTTATSPDSFIGIQRQTTQNTRALKFSGFQLEAGSYCSTPIVTTGAAATRAADWNRITGLNISGPVAVFVEFEWIGADSSVSANLRAIADLSATSANQILIYNLSGAVGGFCGTGGVSQGTSLVTGTVPVNSSVKAAFIAATNRLLFAKGGSLGTTDTSAAVPGALTSLGIGANSYGSSAQASAIIKSIVVIPLDRSDDQLRALTSPAATPITEAVTPDAKLDLMARASLYGITDLSAALDFSRTGVEARFADNYYRKGLFSGASHIALNPTFTRASTGLALKLDGTYQAFASGEPRITDRGILIEEARTNLVLRSADFGVSPWGRTSAGSGTMPTVVSDATIAPDGSMTADQVTFNLNGGTTSGDSSTVLQTGLAATVGVTYTSSIFLKGVAGQKVFVRAPGVNGGLTHTFTGAWDRVAQSGVATISNPSLDIRLIGGNGMTDSMVCNLWGAQLEAGAFATSPIITTGAAATRVADNEVHDAPAIGASFTAFVEAVWPTVAPANGQFLEGLSVANATAGVSMGINSNGLTPRIIVRHGPVRADAIAVAQPAAGSIVKMAVSTDGVTTVCVVNGVVLTNGAGPVQSDWSGRVSVGSRNASLACNTFVRRHFIAPFARTTAELVALTT